MLMDTLRKAGALEGGPTHPAGLPLPLGTRKEGDFVEDELIKKGTERTKLIAEAETLPKVRVGGRWRGGRREWGGERGGGAFALTS